MSRSTPRSAYLTLALACFTVGGAQAGVAPLSGGALSPLAHLSSVQTVQAGECWLQNGPDGPGYYPCGDGGGGGVIVNPRVADPVVRRLGAGAQSPALHGVGAPGAHVSSGIQHGAPPASPGLAGVHEPGAATGAHVGAAASPSSTVSAGVHGPAEAPGAHVGAAASPGSPGSVASAPHVTASPGVVGSAAVPHIAAPAPVGLGVAHAGAATGGPRVAAPALAGVHGAAGGVAGHR
jgi:hypothetical protein